MSFANNWVLILLLFVPLLLWLMLTRGRQGSLNMALSSQDQGFATLIDKIGFYLPLALRLLCIAVLIIALARPQMGSAFSSSKNKGIDIMMVVDTSESMMALDMKLAGRAVDRLEVVKKILQDFVMKRGSDRIGLVVFGENAFTQSPLTTDHGAVVDLINRMEIGMVGKMTAIRSAMALGVKRLKDIKAKSRVMILLTDGQNNAGEISPGTAIDIAKEYGVKIYTVGVGREGKVPFVLDTPIGKQTIMAELMMDEDTLVKISEETGGQYFRAESTEDLQRIYSHIDRLEKTEIEVKEHTDYKDIFEGFLWAALVLLLLELGLGNTILFRLT